MAASPELICTFFVPGIAETKGSWVAAGRGKMRPDNPASKAWENLVAWHAKMAMHQAGKHEPTLDRVSVAIRCTLPHPHRSKFKRDADKLARACLDAMNKIVYRDDEQVDDLHVRKRRSLRSTDFGALITVVTIAEEE